MNIKKLDHKINQVLAGWETPSKQGKKAIWQLVLNETTTKKNNLFLVSSWRWVAAASIIAIIASTALFYASQVNIESLSENKTTFSLPDGSSIILNSKSKVSYNTLTWFANRSVKLSGEGFFTVKKGSQFTVDTPYGTVKVLGTSFNIIAKPNRFIIECYTGKVAINNGKNKVVIKKGEIITQSNNLTFIKNELNQSNLTPQWVTGKYDYQNKKLEVVLNDISDHFGIEIKTNNKINKLTFTGAWNNTMTLDEVLKIVCLPFNLEAVSISNNSYKITNSNKAVLDKSV